MSVAETCRRRVDAPIGNGDATSMNRYSKQPAISYDLYRAIEDLRSVPQLRCPDEVTFDDNVACEEVDQNVSMSGNIVQPGLSKHTTYISTSKVTTISSYLVHTDDSHVGYSSVVVDGDLAGTSSSVPPADQPESKQSSRAHGESSSVEKQISSYSEAGEDDESDIVFVDVATPIDADLLIDDFYEREMDQLDQLDIKTSDDWLNLPESVFTDQSIRYISADSTDDQTSRLLVESSTERRLVHSTSYTTERSSTVEVHCAEVHPQSDRINASSSHVRCSTVSTYTDTSAEELFEEIVESMRDAIPEEDAELDALTDVENQLTLDDTNAKPGPGKLETTVGDGNIVTKEFDASPIQPLTLPSDKQDTGEQNRQNDLTVCLASSLNECLNVLSQINANARRSDSVTRNTIGIGRYRKLDATNNDSMYSPSSTQSPPTNSLGRQYVTSSSSGFQSDVMDLDIEEEFSANVGFDTDDLGVLRPVAESTSVDSLLELNDEDSYQTIVRRPIPSPPKCPDNHSTDSFVDKLTALPHTATVTAGTYVAGTDRTQDDGGDTENGAVVAYDGQPAKVEVLAEELITQEIVLNIVLPRRSKKNKKRSGVDGVTDHSESAEIGVIDRRKSDETPHRDFHIHRVVRCSDADDPSNDRLAVFEDPESKKQKSVTDSQGNMTEDDKQVDSSSVVSPCWSPTSRYMGGPLSVELERNSESAKTEDVDDDTRVRVTHKNRVKVLRAPGGSGVALFNAPVSSITNVVDEIGRTLVGEHHRQSLPPGARVTCDAKERKSSTSLPHGDVTVIRRTIVDDSDIKQSMMSAAVK